MSQSRTTNAARREAKSLHCDSVPASVVRGSPVVCRSSTQPYTQLDSQFAPHSRPGLSVTVEPILSNEAQIQRRGNKSLTVQIPTYLRLGYHI